VIESGLSAGERVVVDGQYKLKPGVSVIESADARKAAKLAEASASGASK